MLQMVLKLHSSNIPKYCHLENEADVSLPLYDSSPYGPWKKNAPKNKGVTQTTSNVCTTS